MIKSWHWDFGDGTTSNDSNPVHEYLKSGKYSVKLTVTNEFGRDTRLYYNYINVKNTSPISDFEASPTIGVWPLKVQFRDKSKTQGNNPIIKRTWRFGDGQQAYSANPEHIYNNPGLYSVTLISESTGGSSWQIKTDYIRVIEGTRRLEVCQSGCDYQSIQGAIDASRDGDTIRVYAGTYFENINFFGKEITVLSINGVESTIIDGQSQNSVVKFVNGEQNAMLQDFTIQNGQAAFGGGIFINASSSPVIKNCIIKNNIAQNDGGGLFASSGSHPKIYNCVFQNNTAENGAGLVCKNSSSPHIANTVFTNNNASNNGGAIYVYYRSMPKIQNVTIDHNSAAKQGGGIFSEGAGVNIQDTYITNNESLLGAGLAIIDNDDLENRSSISLSFIKGNSAEQNGGGLYLNQASISMENCVVFGNHATLGHGIFADQSLADIINCAIVRNSYPEGDAIYASNKTDFSMVNTILWNNGNEIVAISESKVSAEYCDIEGGYPGQGNINADPVFDDIESGNLHIHKNSPCLNKGTSTNAPRYDLDENRRPIDGAIDIGIDERKENTFVTASIYADATYGEEGMTVQFSDRSTSKEIIVKWRWTIDNQTFKTQDPSYTFTQEGTYHISLYVEQYDGDNDTDEKIITVSDSKPQASFYLPGSITEGHTIHLKPDQRSYDSATYQWTFGDGNSSSDLSSWHTYSQEGNYLVTLEITESDGDTDSYSKTIQVVDTEPSAKFSIRWNNDIEPASVQFFILSSGYDSRVCHWSFGDGSFSEKENPVHTYSVEGTYHVVLQIEESDHDTDTYSKEFVVYDAQPTASFTVDKRSGAEPLLVQFTDISTSYESIHKYLWDFGDNHTSTEKNPSHIFEQPGKYAIQLTVTDSDGSQSIKQQKDYILVNVVTYRTVCSSGCDYTSIQAAIDASREGNTIAVYKGSYKENINFNGKLVTVKSVSGDVNETIIDGNQLGTVVSFTSGETNRAILEGFTIQNGLSDTVSGGLFIQNSSPTIRNCKIIDNEGMKGGGLYISNASPNISNCYISDNLSNGSGGGIYCEENARPSITNTSVIANRCLDDGAGLFVDDAAPVISRLTFDENSAMTNGGGVAATNNAELHIKQTSILNNSATRTGGGIHISEHANLSFTNCLFTDNFCRYYGGGAFVSNASLSLLNCTLIYNMAGSGGAIYPDESEVNIKNSILWENGESIESFDSIISVIYSDIQQESDVFPGQGNINADPMFIDINSNFYLKDHSPCIDTGTSNDAPSVDIKGNSRPVLEGFDMGAFENDNTKPQANFKVSETDVLVGKQIEFANFSRSNESIKQYRWNFGDGHTSTDQDPYHSFASPGIYDISLTVYESDNDQSTIFKKGLIHVQGKHPVPDFSATNLYGYKPLTVEFHDQSQSHDYTITNWQWDFGDGTTSNTQNPEHEYTEAGLFTVRLSVTNEAGTKTEKKLNFVNVKDTQPEAAFKAMQKYGRYPLTVKFMDVSRSYNPITNWTWDFGDNSTSNEQHPTHEFQYLGTFNVTLSVTNSDGTDTFTINQCITTVDEIKELIVCESGCEFQRIQDAIDASHDKDSVIVHPGTYNENIDFKGKSIVVKSLQGAQQTIIDGQSAGSVVTFQMSEESAALQGFTIQNGEAEFGGGILIAAAASPKISACEIISNTATKEGGGIAAINAAKPDIINCSIQHNTADNGAGIACKNGASPYIYQTIIKNNNAIKNAGGMYAYFSSFPVIRSGNISNNVSQARGGGIYGNGGTPRLYDTLISGNQAVNGGGIAWFDALYPVLEQITVQGNIAQSNGGGFYALDTSLIKMMNCLISNNSSQQGGAMYFKDVSSSSIEFSTIAYNSASNNGNGILGEKDISNLEINNSILWNSGDELQFDPNDTIKISHSSIMNLDVSAYTDNNMNADPLFVSPGNDYQLGPGSPCKNVASRELSVKHDIEAAKRPAGRSWDMGAYEALNISPTASDQSVQTQEDTPVDISLIASDIDNDEISYIIVDHPSHGTLSGPGPEFTYQPHEDFSGYDSFIFKVNDGYIDSNLATVSISIAPVVDVPIISVNDSEGNEDTQIKLRVNEVKAGDLDNSESLSQVTISNVPEGFQLSNGTNNGDGTWTTSPQQAKNIYITPSAYVSGNYPLSISVSATENNQTEFTTVAFQLTVIPVANKPVLNLVDTASGDEDTPISLSIDEPSLVDLDGSEKLSHITISNVPDGATLSVGINNNNGSWTLTFAELANLIIQPKQHDANNFNLNVSVDAIEQANNHTDTTNKEIAVTVKPVADKPVLSVNENVSGDEDTHIPLIIQPELTDKDGSEKIADITINNVPVGAKLTNGINNGDGSWTLTEPELIDLNVTPKAHVADDFTLNVTIKSEEIENGDFHTDSQSITVDVIPVADPPHLTVTTYTSGNEDTAIPLTIAEPVLEDQDGSENLSDIHIFGVPENAFLSKGTVVDGCWILKSDELEGLSIMPVVHDSNDYTLTIAITATENENLVTATTEKQIVVDIIPVADPPILSVENFTTGDEDTPIPLTIHDAVLVDKDGSEVLSNLTVTNLPAGAILSEGVETANGTWIVPLNQLENLTVTPKEHNADNFVLSLSLSATERENNLIETVTQSITVTVIPVADLPELVVVDQAVTLEDVPITLTIAPPGLVDKDQSEYLSDITIAGMPDDAILSEGEKEGNNWIVKSETLANLILTPAQHDGNDITLTISVIATEHENNDQATQQKKIIIDVISVADTPLITVTNATGNEDTQIPLNIQPVLVDSDGSEVFSLITISNMPDEAVLSAGTKNAENWTVHIDQLSNLTVLPKYNDSNDFTLTVHVSAIEQENNDSSGITKTVQVDVIPVADPPSLTVHSMTSGDEDTAITLTISPPTLVDSDGSEELSDIKISHVPDGASLSKGSSVDEGIWQLTADELENLSITPSLHNADNFVLNISALSTEKENNDQATTQNP
ncbi:MAG: hypothetical protein OMM_00803 [Candidatus Magnetoglobus multicellularis str. Araruama]|uniref:PKD domain-containing protein n=1 Tax=Candidatus Magnetoglobus multicellularis str. Araruama TaxID=890399 RepID=A0A1V1PFS3_9BACT|nr:MAG: hypothetical protein OMM_00803 [Candidatus Magnetoglobus multicellularis str. Araruama]